MTVCAIVSQCKCIACGMMMKGSEKVKPGASTQPTPFDKLQGDCQAVVLTLSVLKFSILIALKFS